MTRQRDVKWSNHIGEGLLHPAEVKSPAHEDDQGRRGGCREHRTGRGPRAHERPAKALDQDRKSTRLNSSHDQISYAVFCLKKKKKTLDTNATELHHLR